MPVLEQLQCFDALRITSEGVRRGGAMRELTGRRGLAGHVRQTRAPPVPGRLASQTCRPTDVTRPSKLPGRPGRRPTPPRPGQTRPVKPTDNRSDTDPQKLRKSIVRVQEANAWGRRNQWRGARKPIVGVHETNCWNPTNQWLRGPGHQL